MLYAFGVGTFLHTVFSLLELTTDLMRASCLHLPVNFTQLCVLQ